MSGVPSTSTFTGTSTGPSTAALSTSTIARNHHPPRRFVPLTRDPPGEGGVRRAEHEHGHEYRCAEHEHDRVRPRASSTLPGRVGSEPRRASGEGLFGLTSSNSKPYFAGCFAHVGQGRRLAHKAANRSRDEPSPPVRSPHPRPSRGGWCPACRARARARARDMNRPRGQTIFLASAITLPIAKRISRSALAPGYYKCSQANRSRTLARRG